ncbi:MAG: Peptidoglycan-binding domain 1 protein [Moraxellaceae bacterium]|jgi:peptidoglycan hydrolase-like protein with peptidoglycan-binding domain|nr:Peptidoglycan-binding domain 1 protein [Moraxellaceae bacterium]
MQKHLFATAALAAAMAIAPAYAKQKDPDAQASQQQSDAEGTQIYLDAPAVQQVQQALNAKGFNAGSIDGQWSTRTKQAAQEYQRSAGIDPTGTLTVELLNSLGLSSLLTGQGMQQGSGQAASGAAAKGVPVHVGSTAVRQVQQALSQQGFPVQSVDGRWGPGTEKAVENFQRVNDLEPTGKLDTGLITALGVGQQIFSAGQQQGQQAQQQQQGQQQQQAQQQSQQQTRQGQQQQAQQGQQQPQQQSQQQQAQRSPQQGQPPQQQGQPQQGQQAQQGQQPPQQSTAQQGQPQGQPPQQQAQQSQAPSQQQGQPPQQQASSLKGSRKASVGPGTPLWAGPETVRQVQQALNRNGFGVDAVDGDWDRQTAQALRKFQQARGIAPTGALTVQSLASLGLGNVLTGQGGQEQQNPQQQQNRQRPSQGTQQGQPQPQRQRPQPQTPPQG